MPIAHIEKDRVRARDSRAFGLGTWLDHAGIETHADDADDWYMDAEDNYVGPGKLVWMGTREVWHGDLLTHVDEYEYERPNKGLPLPINPDYEEPDHIARCRSCSRRTGCLYTPETTGCLIQRYPATRQELMER